MKIRFLPEGAEYTFAAGRTVLALAAEAGVAIDGNCGGNGVCGKCKVRVISGNGGQPGEEERSLMTAGEIKAGYRLACKFLPCDDVTVEVPRTEDAVKRKKKLTAMPEGFLVKSGFQKKFICVEEATIEKQEADLEKIKRQCGLDSHADVSAAVIKKLPDVLAESRNITVTIFENKLVDVEPDDTSGFCYGAAFDIGTTTVVGYLWNLITGEQTGVSAAANPQGVYGADVISRITYAGESEQNLENLHNAAIGCINEIISGLSETHCVKPEHIYRITVAGNSTMSHLFLGVSPRQLAVAPFVPVFVKSVTDSAFRQGIRINENAQFHLLPNIAGHVGSDITADVISTGIMKKDGIHLLIDIGTNGEIVLAGRGSALTCSTAAGPAFEGASIFKGMRAAAGAIERVRIDEDVHLQVIGNTMPKGICGSGIIDAAAQLVSNGLIDRTGRFIKPEAAAEKNIPELLLQRLRRRERGTEFVLAFDREGDDVVILQKDIREVQLAKAAICAGIRIMMNRMGIADDDLDGIHIAGAFGSYINVESALAIGLLPQIDKQKITSEGNAAGTGACMTLLSEDMRKEVEIISTEIRHVELAACPEFQEEYLKAMSF